jgi:hypothetical protein
VPLLHRTDRMTAVNNLTEQADFQKNYQTLLRHYGLEGRKIQTGQPNENGDVEQRHYRLRRALDQALLLRGSRDFAAVEAYGVFLSNLFEQLNSGRRPRLVEEMERLRPLPDRRLDTAKRVRARVNSGSLIVVERNSYSVNSRLIGEIVEARVFPDRLEIWYGGQKMEQLPRLRGRTNYRVDYRHIIDWLVRKPGAVASYRYREQSFSEQPLPHGLRPVAGGHGCGWHPRASGDPMNFTLFITLVIVTTIFTTFVGRHPTTARSAVMQAALRGPDRDGDPLLAVIVCISNP